MLKNKSAYILFLFLTSAHFVFGETISLTSPDKTVQLTVKTTPKLSYSVLMDNQPLILDSELQIEFGDDSKIAMPLEWVDSHRSYTDHRWQPVHGRKSEIQDLHNQIEIVLREQTGPRRLFSLIARAYNDGVAFRFKFGKEMGQHLSIKEERTQFTLPGNPVAWPAFLNSFTTMHETTFPRQQLSRILPIDIVGLPLTIQVAPDRYCSILEASLVDWAGMYLTREGQLPIWLESDEVFGGGAPYVFDKALPPDASELRIVLDAVGDNSYDHVDIADFKVTLEEGSTIWLSELSPIQARQDWGSLKTDQSVEGNPLTIAGKVYKKGVGTHANGLIAYTLPKSSRRLSGKVGIDAEVGSRGRAKVRFIVIPDQKEVDRVVLRSLLSRRGNSATAVEVKLPHLSPWRVIQVGRCPADLLNSDIILNLNEPCKMADTSWIKAGVASWNWLSSGSQMDMELLKSYIDLAGEMNWEYTLIDDGWYGSWQDDVTTPIEGLDIPALVDYAAKRNVKLWLWTHWQAFDRHLEEALALYQKWGIAGVKTDFMSRDDQEMVNWYYKVLETAARYKIMIDFHGSYKPTGQMRTWPNMMTCEAVFGNEQNLWSNLNDPVHKTTLAFTRQLAGPMDYTPGSFLNATADSWRTQRPIRTLGTRCQEMALFVVYDSPFMCTADLPANYYGQDGVEFLNDIPASWDDTIVLDGGIGEFVVTARRKGNQWYLGGITNWDARTVAVPLGFLGEGRYQATVYEDGPEAAQNARHVKIRRLTVHANETLTVTMAPGGGFAAILSKMP